MSVRNTWQEDHTTAFVPHYFMPEGQFYAKRFLSVTGSHLWCCSNAIGLPASLLVRRPHCDRTIAPLGAEACQWLFSFPLAKCLTMRHPKLPKILNNWLIINLGNLFVQKCDEVKKRSAEVFWSSEVQKSGSPVNCLLDVAVISMCNDWTSGLLDFRTSKILPITPPTSLDFANASPYLRKIVLHGLSLPMELWV